MKLYLMRHGEAQTQGLDKQQLDTLSEHGHSAILRMADFCKSKKIQVARIFHSQKIRAKQTAELIATGIHSINPMQERAGLNPSDDVVKLAEEINSWDEDVLLIGHLPFMPRLVGYLLLRNENQDLILFDPGTLVCLENIKHQGWLIHWVINPDIP